MAFKPKIKQDEIPEQVDGRIVLIDGDMIAYYAAAPFEEDDYPIAVNIEIDRRINKIVQDTGSEFYAVFLTGLTNFRDDIATFKQYKGNRYNADGSRRTERPKHFYAARSHMRRSHKAEWSKGEEADDSISIAANMYRRNGADVVIASGDKDLKINTGKHFCIITGEFTENFGKGHIEAVESAVGSAFDVSGAGLMFFFYQLIAGDYADNIPGLPKLGEQTAKRYGLRRGGAGKKAAFTMLGERTLLEQCAFTRVVAAYWDYFNTHGDYTHWKTGEQMPGYYSYLVEQMQLLWMRQEKNQMITPEELFNDKHIMEKVLEDIAYGRF